MKIKEYIGNPDQLWNVQEYTLKNGKAKGVDVIDIETPKGMRIMLLPDKCLDIYRLSINGKCVNYITPNGIVAPAYYNGYNGNFLSCFAAGFLTTCGFENIGKDSFGEDKPLPMHGSIANTPAESYSVERTEKGVTVSAKIRDAKLFGGNLLLIRTIEISENSFEIRDRVINEGYKYMPFMVLYHMNIGYPLLSPDTILTLPSHTPYGRDKYAELHKEEQVVIFEPQDDFRERCYYHFMEEDENGFVNLSLNNEKENLKLNMSYSKENLDNFVQWQMFGKGEYVMGLEPCNASIDGYDAAKDDDTLKVIAPGQEKEMIIQISLEN